MLRSWGARFRKVSCPAPQNNFAEVSELAFVHKGLQDAAVLQLGGSLRSSLTRTRTPASPAVPDRPSRRLRDYLRVSSSIPGGGCATEGLFHSHGSGRRSGHQPWSSPWPWPRLSPRSFSDSFCTNVRPEDEDQQKELRVETVDRHNFDEVFDRTMKGAIEAADFISIDMELSGLEAAAFRRPMELDTAQTRYLNVRHSAKHFAIIQLGLCTFRWNQDTGRHIVQPFNCHVFGRSMVPGFKDTPSRVFMSQFSSLEFLSKHKLDFTTWVQDGISFLSEGQEQTARVALTQTFEERKWERHSLGARLDSTVPQSNQKETMEVQTRDKGQTTQPWTGGARFKDRIQDRLQIWNSLIKSERGSPLPAAGGPAEACPELQCDQVAEGGSLSLDDDSATGPEHDTGHPPEALVKEHGQFVLSIPRLLNPDERSALHQVIREHFPMFLVYSSPEDVGPLQHVRVFACSTSEERSVLETELALKDKESMEAVLLNAVGLRRVLDAISKSRKPIVGHNCLLDMAHVLHHFYGPLPGTVEEFCGQLLKRFPGGVFDTRFCVRVSKILRSRLASLNASLDFVYGQALKVARARTATLPVEAGSLSAPGLGPFVVLDTLDSTPHYISEGKITHEAGHDAFITGFIFAEMCSLLQVKTSNLTDLSQFFGRSDLEDPPPQGLPALAALANAVVLGRAGNKETALDLYEGRPPVAASRTPPNPKVPPFRLPDRRNVALLWNVPEWASEATIRDNVQSLFKRPVGLQVDFLDDGAAFVEFYRSSALHDFMQVVQQMHKPGWRDGNLSFFGKDGVRAARFNAYEAMCSSNLQFLSVSEGAEALGLAGSTLHRQALPGPTISTLSASGLQGHNHRDGQPSRQGQHKEQRKVKIAQPGLAGLPTPSVGVNDSSVVTPPRSSQEASEKQPLEVNPSAGSTAPLRNERSKSSAADVPSSSPLLDDAFPLSPSFSKWMRGTPEQPEQKKAGAG